MGRLRLTLKFCPGKGNEGLARAKKPESKGPGM